MTQKIKTDLHVHSCLSPCADDDMTPANLVQMAKLSGIELLALTDHNSCKNCRSAVHFGKQFGVQVLPGMELCTAEEIHCICLFETVEAAENFGAYVCEHMPRIQNRPEIFGNQSIVDQEDHVVATEPLLLTTASSIPVDEVKCLVTKFGGICFPAHLDRASYSLLSVLGAPYKELDFTAAEFTKQADIEAFQKQYPLLQEMQMIRNSDAHRLEQLALSEPEELPLENCSFRALKSYLETNPSK